MNSHLAPRTATRLQPLSSLHSPLQSPEGPAAAGQCRDTQSAVESHPKRQNEKMIKMNDVICGDWVFR